MKLKFDAKEKTISWKEVAGKANEFVATVEGGSMTVEEVYSEISKGFKIEEIDSATHIVTGLPATMPIPNPMGMIYPGSGSVSFTINGEDIDAFEVEGPLVIGDPDADWCGFDFRKALEEM